jgi:hypothetical protein
MGLNTYVMAEDFFRAVGISATQLTEVFGGKPKNDTDYEALESFGIGQAETRLGILARILDRPVVVHEAYGDGDNTWRFIVFQDGQVSTDRSSIP